MELTKLLSPDHLLTDKEFEDVMKYLDKPENWNKWSQHPIIKEFVESCDYDERMVDQNFNAVGNVEGIYVSGHSSGGLYEAPYIEYDCPNDYFILTENGVESIFEVYDIDELYIKWS